MSVAAVLFPSALKYHPFTALAGGKLQSIILANVVFSKFNLMLVYDGVSTLMFRKNYTLLFVHSKSNRHVCFVFLVYIFHQHTCQLYYN